MARVITLSRQFLQGHPKAGQPTFFVHAVWKALTHQVFHPHTNIIDALIALNQSVAESDIRQFEFNNKISNVDTWSDLNPKLHTIRAGKRWKTGDMCSLRVWSGMPYRSKQIAIAPDFALPRVADIEIDFSGEIKIDGVFYGHHEILAKNDGLSERDFCNWIGKNFSGQILFFTDTKTPY